MKKFLISLAFLFISYSGLLAKEIILKNGIGHDIGIVIGFRPVITPEAIMQYKVLDNFKKDASFVIDINEKTFEQYQSIVFIITPGVVGRKDIFNFNLKKRISNLEIIQFCIKESEEGKFYFNISGTPDEIRQSLRQDIYNLIKRIQDDPVFNQTENAKKIKSEIQTLTQDMSSEFFNIDEIKEKILNFEKLLKDVQKLIEEEIDIKKQIRSAFCL